MGKWTVHEVSGGVTLKSDQRRLEKWDFVLLVGRPDSKYRVSHLKYPTLQGLYGVVPSPILAELKIGEDRIVSRAEGILYIHALANKFNQIEDMYGIYER